MKISYLASLVLILALTACSTVPPSRLPPVDDRSSTGDRAIEPYVRDESAPPAPRSQGAVVALLDKADDYRRAGNNTGEAAVIERALRIEPNNAHLWSRLAATRLDQGQPHQAEQLALKSNALARNDVQLRARNWSLVAKARWTLNDAPGARAAEQKALELRGR